MGSMEAPSTDLEKLQWEFVCVSIFLGVFLLHKTKPFGPGSQTWANIFSFLGMDLK